MASGSQEMTAGVTTILFMRYVVIMAGERALACGRCPGKARPSNCLLIGGVSLLRLAFERALRLVPAERVIVVTGAAYLDEVRADLPEIPPGNLLGEPEGATRSTRSHGPRRC